MFLIQPACSSLFSTCSIRLWDVKAALKAHTDPKVALAGTASPSIHALAISPDASLLATACKVWVATARMLALACNESKWHPMNPKDPWALM